MFPICPHLCVPQFFTLHTYEWPFEERFYYFPKADFFWDTMYVVAMDVAMDNALFDDFPDYAQYMILEFCISVSRSRIQISSTTTTSNNVNILQKIL